MRKFSSGKGSNNFEMHVLVRFKEKGELVVVEVGETPGI